MARKWLTPLLFAIGNMLLIDAQPTCPSTGQATQVHVTPAGSNAVYISFASTSFSAPSRVLWGNTTPPTTYAYGTSLTVSELLWYSSQLISPVIGPPTTTLEHLAYLQGITNVSKVQLDVGAVYTMPLSYYNSPMLNRVLLSNLNYGVLYYYQVEGCSTIFSFTIPAPSTLPYTLALTSDLDYTIASQVTLQNLLALNANIFVLPGDLSYADGYGDRWDAWGRFIEPLAASMPTLVVGGNHEVQTYESWVNFNNRWPTPSHASGSPDNTYFSYNNGPVHFIGLNSYADTTPNGTQGLWLQQDIKTINRTATPWILVFFHVPWYTSSTVHHGEATKMITDFEPILYKAGANLVLCGHDHNYERSYPMVNYSVDPCGITHFIIGDGGSREGLYKPWITPQPSYSAFRQASFGFSKLVIYNSTHALFTRTKTCCEGYPTRGNLNCTQSCVDPNDNANNSIPVDQIWLVRNLSCANQLYTGQSSSSSPTTSTDPTTTSTTSSSDNTGWVAATGVLAALLGVAVASIAVLVYMLHSAKSAAAYGMAFGEVGLPEGFYPPTAYPMPTPFGVY